MGKLNREHIVGAVCLIIAGVTFALASQLPTGQNAIGVSGPALFPNILAAILALTGVAELVVGFRRTGVSATISLSGIIAAFKRREVVNVFLIIGLWILYELLFETIGFIITTIAFLFIIMVRLGVSLPKSVAISVVYTGVIYLLFTVLFSISMPSGVLAVLGL